MPRLSTSTRTPSADTNKTSITCEYLRVGRRHTYADAYSFANTDGDSYDSFTATANSNSNTYGYITATPTATAYSYSYCDSTAYATPTPTVLRGPVTHSYCHVPDPHRHRVPSHTASSRP